MERCSFTNSRTVSTSARLHGHSQPVIYRNKQGCDVRTSQNIIIPSKYQLETQSLPMEDTTQYVIPCQHANQVVMSDGRPTQLSFIDPIDTHKYISTSDGTVQPTSGLQYEQPAMMTSNPSQFSNLQRVGSRISQPPGSFVPVTSFQQPNPQNTNTSSRPLQDLSKMSQDPFVMMQNVSRMTPNGSRMYSNSSRVTQDPSRGTQSGSRVTQDPSRGTQSGSRPVGNPSRISEYSTGGYNSPCCMTNGQVRMTGMQQSQQVVSYPVPPYALDQPCACNNPIPFSSTQSNIQSKNHVSPKCTCGLEQQNLQMRASPISPSMMPYQSTISAGRPYMYPSNIREQPTRDNDMTCPCARNSAQPFKVSPFGGCTAQMKIMDTPEALCLPCGHTFSDTLKDTCWRVKIMKDVGVLTRGLDHAIQTQTSETRIVNANKLESLLPSTERFDIDESEMSRKCKICFEEYENPCFESSGKYDKPSLMSITENSAYVPSAKSQYITTPNVTSRDKPPKDVLCCGKAKTEKHSLAQISREESAESEEQELLPIRLSGSKRTLTEDEKSRVDDGDDACGCGVVGEAGYYDDFDDFYEGRNTTKKSCVIM